MVTVIVGFDTTGTVSGVWADASTQTAGIGSKVGEADYLAQFNGMNGTANITADVDFDGVTGATYSTNALFAAINDCINCYNELA